jgi:hypothetical protein
VSEQLPVRLVLAEGGSFHTLVVEIPAALVERYDRLIDLLREEPAVTGAIYVDHRRLVAAYIDNGGGDS